MRGRSGDPPRGTITRAVVGLVVLALAATPRILDPATAGELTTTVGPSK